MSSLYLHIPFCLSKCHYCSFSSQVADPELYRSYTHALIEELKGLVGSTDRGNPEPLKSIFVGGGTPTCLPVELLQEIIQTSVKLFGKNAEAEISVEANPGTVDRGYLQALKCAGVNRLSIGVQSFDTGELLKVGRIHTADEACCAIEAARDAGFDNINLDLMSGLPGQTALSWHTSLERALSFQPEHLSLYQLTIEEETPFYQLVESGRMVLPEEDEVLAMDEITRQLTAAAGLVQYETSNFARKGRECYHNINYWLNQDYFAAGAAAVSCLQGVRQRRLSDPLNYIDKISAGQSVIIETEKLSREESFRETVIMGLRLVEGVSRSVLQQRYDLDLVEYYGTVLEKQRALGFLQLTESHLRITDKGWPFANQIMADLV